MNNVISAELVKQLFLICRYGDSLWTWVCASNRCERREKTDEPAVSMATCNMLCGSTQLWPQPTGPVQLASHSVTFNLAQLRFETSAQEEDRQLLQEAYTIFKANIRALSVDETDRYTPSDVTEFLIKVLVTSFDHRTIHLNTDETYNLTLLPIEKDLVATIQAKTYFGARHGLETLSQLIWSDETKAGSVLRVLKGARIQDSPKFPYRGLMIDTARQFFSVPSLKRVLTGMSACKLNVFHWHISDSQSFPFASPRVPQMAKYGAYSSDMVYTAEDVKEIVEFARVRGIRVLIEIDAPAHAGNGWNWGQKYGMGELALCVNLQPWSMYCGEPPCGQLNPDNPFVYSVLEDLYRDVLELSGEREMFHLGGDEVNLHCWELRQQGKTSSYNYTDLHDVWGNFTLQAIQRLEKANNAKPVSSIIVWSSDLTKKPYVDKYLDKNKIIVQIWGGSTWPESTDLLSDGYRVILSHVDAWYLDCGFGKWRETGGAACDPYKTWQVVYSHRPWSSWAVHTEKRSLLLGGETCLWTEQVDEMSLDTRLWPRVAAFAERIWSDPKIETSDIGLEYTTVHEDVYTRLDTHRERLISRGLKAEALWPRWCVQNPGMCL